MIKLILSSLVPELYYRDDTRQVLQISYKLRLLLF